MSLSVLFRPWAWLSPTARHRVDLGAGKAPLLDLAAEAVWLALNEGEDPQLDRRRDSCCPAWPARREKALDVRGYILPIPLRRSCVELWAGTAVARLDYAGFPERPEEGAEDAEDAARVLLDRVKAVWARLREVETTLADPERVWERLAEKWLSGESALSPEMDIIVRHARKLPRLLDPLGRNPRRILRRSSRQVPLDRVQELDRKAMAWLARQPGETIAERAGDRQRIEAVTRLENFNTLENRVLASYVQLAQRVARDYRAQYKGGDASGRVRSVRLFGQRCGSLARDLRARGVQVLTTGVVPNFVLQNNRNYHAVWEAWGALLHRERVLDELWRWQARSWEEFCALVVVVALQSLPQARLIAASPLIFREEQERGCWIRHVNPLAVFHLPDSQVTIEVSYRAAMGSTLEIFAAPVWLRLGRTGGGDFLSRWAVWPIWTAAGGLVPGEAEEVAELVPSGRSEHMKGGIVLRPVQINGAAEQECRDSAGCFTLGASGDALRDAVLRVRAFMDEVVLK